MKRYEGMHFYINISNFDDVVEKEEQESGYVNHSIHALNTFFSTVEWFGKQKYGEVFVVEKVTGARLHMYIIDDIRDSYKVLKTISAFASKLVDYINNDISKYKKLGDLHIQIGACHGQFYDFVFNDGGYEEETTIGFAANYAAKLQMLSSDGFISISSATYEELDREDAFVFEEKNDIRIRKYEQQCYYTAEIARLLVDDSTFEYGLEHAFDIVQKTNLADMNNEPARLLINPDTLSIKTIKKVTGIPLFADVRGFTEKFRENNINLKEMADKTQGILSAMYAAIKMNGVHIQFQGDRECALFHEYGDNKCAVDAVIAAMRIIDRVKKYKVNVGVGESMGTVFASRIGARGEKDNVLIGRTVTVADRFEDDCADKNQLVISEEIYRQVKMDNPILAKQFKKSQDGFYMTQVGYKSFCEAVEDEKLSKNNRDRNYNGAWCEEDRNEK